MPPDRPSRLIRYDKNFSEPTLIGIAGPLNGLGQPEVGNSTEAFFPAAQPARVSYDQFRNEFLANAPILVLAETPRLFAAPIPGKVRALHDEPETTVPHVARVPSLVNARVTEADAGALVVTEFLDSIPQDSAGWGDLRQPALSNNTSRNVLLDESGYDCGAGCRRLDYSSVFRYYPRFAADSRPQHHLR